MVSHWTLFVAREVGRRRGLYEYRLRNSSLRLALRHGTGDAATLTEVFHLRYYEPPAEIAQAIGDPRLIIDLGANVGFFGAFASERWPNAQIVAYEPDPSNAAVHARTVAANKLADRWSLVPAAAGASDADVRFVPGLEALSHVAAYGTPELPTEVSVTMHDVLPQICGADLVKMDIEGGEWEILLDERLRRDPPRAIVLEVHPQNCPDTDPLTAADLALKAAGLETSTIWARDDGHAMLWGWRRVRGS
jgi:FkbM family methyltransferase